MTFFPAPVNAHQVGDLAIRKWPEGSRVNALFAGENDCYRYWLYEQWNNSLPALVYILMNPSVASAQFADPTLAQTGKLARSLGYGAQIIINMYAYRSTNHLNLLSLPASDAIGPDNDFWIDAIAAAGLFAIDCPSIGSNEHDIIVGCGTMAKQLAPRGLRVAKHLHRKGHKLLVFKLSRMGFPWHPLYIPVGTQPIAWRP